VRKALQWIFQILGAIFVVGFFAKTLSQETLSLTLGGIFLSLAFIGTFFLMESFGEYLKTRHPEKETKNLADALSFENAKVLKNASSSSQAVFTPSPSRNG